MMIKQSESSCIPSSFWIRGAVCSPRVLNSPKYNNHVRDWKLVLEVSKNEYDVGPIEG